MAALGGVGRMSCSTPIVRVRRGVVNIWACMVLLALVALLGLAMDTGWSALTLSQLQASSDAAALGGALKVLSDQSLARTKAQAVGQANLAANAPVNLNLNTGNVATGDIVLGTYNTTTNVFTPTTISPNAVKVHATQTASLAFGPIFGRSSVTLRTDSIAIARNAGAAAVIVLNPFAPCALDLGGNSGLFVTNGGIQVNSSNGTAVCNNGHPVIAAPEMNVVGGVEGGITVQGGNMNTGASVIDDPLSTLPAPPDGTAQAKPAKNGNVTIKPGYYANGISRNNGSLTLQSGIYVLNDDFSVTGGNLSGQNVMIYMKGGTIDFRGNGSFTLTPPNTGTYKDVTIFQAHGNSAGAQINGNNNMNIQGTLYFPSANVDVRGTGASIGNQIIAWTMSLGGTGDVNVPYNGTFPVGQPRVYLVQ
jgi:Flp pilus assembly protein TadG